MPRPAQANLVENGGFETGGFTGWTQFELTDINSLGDSLSGVDGTMPKSGSKGAFFGQQSSIGRITQAITVISGAKYQIDFWLANDFYGVDPNDPQDCYFELMLAGNSVALLNGIVAAFDYTHYSFAFDAVADGPFTIGFGFQHEDGYFELDDVSVERVPEAAATAGLLGLGLAGLAGMRRKLS
jgi:hypothetical protein